ncbi:hypothetical protein B4Q13_18515 [Lacticaseibacillus rhamnosus]
MVAAVIGHDLLLMPLYTLADRSVVAVFRHRPLSLPAGPWINYLRVPATLSGVLLLIWFPLILRLPARFPVSTTLPLNPYLWHWLAVTGALFLLSATALALRWARPGDGRARSDALAPRHACQLCGHERGSDVHQPAGRYLQAYHRAGLLDGPPGICGQTCKHRQRKADRASARSDRTDPGFGGIKIHRQWTNVEMAQRPA